jgi:hypothetical protein
MSIRAVLRFPPVLLFVALVAANCSSTQITSNQPTLGAAATPPEAVVVGTIVVPPETVTLDRGLMARLRRRVTREATEQTKREVAQAVGAVVQQTILRRLNGAGLKASAGPADITLAQAPTLAIGGTVRTVDEGNRTRRNVIGFGAGRSQVSADIQVTEVAAGGRRPLLSFVADTRSGRRPGAVVTGPLGAAGAGVAVAAGTAVGSSVVSQRLSANVEALARKLGDAAADRILAFAAEQGWIAGSAN